MLEEKRSKGRAAELWHGMRRKSLVMTLKKQDEVMGCGRRSLRNCKYDICSWGNTSDRQCSPLRATYLVGNASQ